jgi:hypothetical protein
MDLHESQIAAHMIAKVKAANAVEVQKEHSLKSLPRQYRGV